MGTFGGGGGGGGGSGLSASQVDAAIDAKLIATDAATEAAMLALANTVQYARRTDLSDAIWKRVSNGATLANWERISGEAGGASRQIDSTQAGTAHGTLGQSGSTLTTSRNYAAGTINVYWNGQLLDTVGTYSFVEATSNTLTLSFTPEAGDEFIAEYNY